MVLFYYFTDWYCVVGKSNSEEWYLLIPDMASPQRRHHFLTTWKLKIGDLNFPTFQTTGGGGVGGSRPPGGSRLRPALGLYAARHSQKRRQKPCPDLTRLVWISSTVQYRVLQHAGATSNDHQLQRQLTFHSFTKMLWVLWVLKIITLNISIQHSQP